MKCRINVMICLSYPRSDMANGEFGCFLKFSQHAEEGEEERRRNLMVRSWGLEVSTYSCGAIWNPSSTTQLGL